MSLADFDREFQETDVTISSSEFSKPPLGQHQAMLMRIDINQMRDGGEVIDFAFQVIGGVHDGILYRKRHYVESGKLEKPKQDLVRFGLNLDKLSMLYKENVRQMAYGKIFNMNVSESSNTKRNGEPYINIWINQEVIQERSERSEFKPQHAAPFNDGPEFKDISDTQIEEDLERNQPYGF